MGLTEYERQGGPGTSVYIVQCDREAGVEFLMVFDNEAEAMTYAADVGGAVLDSEPVFDTAAHCHEWCGTEPYQEED